MGHPQHVYLGDGGAREKYAPGVEGICTNNTISSNLIYNASAALGCPIRQEADRGVDVVDPGADVGRLCRERAGEVLEEVLPAGPQLEVEPGKWSRSNVSGSGFHWSAPPPATRKTLQLTPSVTTSLPT